MRTLFWIGVQSFRTTWRQRGALVLRLGLYLVLMVVFSRLWAVTTPERAADLIWYVMATEWVILSVPTTHLEIEEDIRNGALAYQILRPTHYGWMKWAEGMGVMLARMLPLGVAGWSFAYLLSGQGPDQPEQLAVVILLGLLSGTAYVVFHTCIGLTSFWLHECAPLAWVWQKLSFVFGGLYLPLSFYPEWMLKLSKWTPFYALLYGVGRPLLPDGRGVAAETFARIFLWGLIGSLMLIGLFEVGRKKLAIGGG